MDKQRKNELARIAAQLRLDIIEEVYSAHSGHPGGSLSIADIVTVLYFEDVSVVDKFMEAYPLYSSNFKTWSQHTSAMHQFTIWTMLEDLGFGASLQHYNPLIDEEVKRTWHLPKEWNLIAQMPFGMPLSAPGEKKMKPLAERVKVFG